VKILVTNIQEDAEIRDSSATDIIERALYYLREHDRKDTPAPFLITHYLINDPTQSESDASYVPFGRLQSLEDPRLLRIANYEDGRSGRHNASKVLTPFLQAFVHAERRLAVAVLLLDTDSLDKVCQTILEAARAGLESQPVDVTFFYRSPQLLDDTLASTLPFRAHCVATAPGSGTGLFEGVDAEGYDFTVLFESSGMYRGEDIVNVVSLLVGGRLDAVWGSRRLSTRDIRESYHLRYRRSPLLGAISYVGSHVLSLMYLVLYGRYISDALSGVRAVRSTYLLHPSIISLDDKRLNQVLLSRILRQEGQIFETPVQFFSLSPDKANRTTLADGLRFVGAILTSRFRGQ
jgi:hypothetical protein